MLQNYYKYYKSITYITKVLQHHPEQHVKTITHKQQNVNHHKRKRGQHNANKHKI